jgi:hypothetical protein
MKKLISIICILLASKSIAQDTLPNFSLAILKGSKAQISWTNPFSNCIQLSVQKSYDSLRFFQTIFSTQSPELPQNGYVDNNFIPQVKIFYRIFYVLEDGKYFFTQSKAQSSEKSIVKIAIPNKTEDIKPNNIPIDIKLIDKPTPDSFPRKRLITIYKKNRQTLLNVLDEAGFQKFRDSISLKTKDTLLTFENDIIILKPFIPKPLWKPSLNIYTNNKGFVSINLPEASKNHKYRIVFYDETNTEIFRIKLLKLDKLVLEKSNFLHAGWFFFELFEDDTIVEKNKFYLDKNF